ncbi:MULTISPECIES: hypothetical protein [unclassified Streptomyces]|uniref:hypothetical protein n=1 Tax=unclassified Streptomyces TaxID=2593676 RepID=UPI001CBDFBDA|nr:MULTISPECIES: hypothetical protein [unclassified Streptomyces]WPO75552.1 hypothetical protein R9806_35615 [Streptomyces sp. KN37]
MVLDAEADHARRREFPDESERHGVSRHTIRRALDAPRPADHELTRRRPLPVVTPRKSLIDPLLDEGLDPKEIWVRIID